MKSIRTEDIRVFDMSNRLSALHIITKIDRTESTAPGSVERVRVLFLVDTKDTSGFTCEKVP